MTSFRLSAHPRGADEHAVRAAWITALIFFVSIAGRAEQLPIRVYTTADGLAQNEINRIVRDQRGFLWFCTAEGLSRFDGYTFTNYGTDHGLPHNGISDLLITRSGEYWVGTYGGLVRFNPRGAASNSPVSANTASAAAPPMFGLVEPSGDDRRSRAITVLLEGRDGTIWCGTWKGLYRLEIQNGNHALRSVSLGKPGEDQPLIGDLIEDRYGTLWAATPEGLYRRWPDGSTARYTPRDGLPDHHLHDLLEDREGRLWAATRHAGFFQFSADATHAPPVVARAHSVAEGLPSPWVFQLFQTSDNRFWIGSNLGLVEFFPERGTFRSYGPRNGLSYQEVSVLDEDAGGNLWLGTSTSGAMKLVRNGFVTYGEGDGLRGVHGLFEDGTGAVCFRGYVLGDRRNAKIDSPSAVDRNMQRFGRFDGLRFTWFAIDAIRDAELGWVTESVTLRARSGEWWIGTGAGLFRFPPIADFTQLRSARPLAVYRGSQVYSLFEDARGDIWMNGGVPGAAGQRSGLFRWERATGTLLDLSRSPGLPSLNEESILAFGEDRAGNVWISFSTGVVRYREGRFTRFGASDGLPRGSITTIKLDRAGRLWLGSSASGLVRVDEPDVARPAFRSYTSAEGLSSNLVEVLGEDLRGRIYAGTGRGLDRLEPDTGRIRHFTTADGLAPGGFRAALRDRNGVLWFGMVKGLSRLVPPDDEPAGAPPPIVISSLQIAGAPRAVSALGETEISLGALAPELNRLQFDFVGLSFTLGEVLLYEYMLEGAGAAAWSRPTEQRTLQYANLAPGRYRFLVRALNSDGASSAQPATVSFTILPPVWQRWWFLLIAALAISAAVYALYRYRVARIFEVANIRGRIATDLHDDIGSSLSQIAILSEVVRRHAGDRDPRVTDPLSHIASVARELVDTMSDIVWAIDPEHDRLGDLVQRMRRFAGELFEARNIGFELHVLDGVERIEVGPYVRREVFRIFKEAIHNILRHSQCTEVRVEFGVERERIVLRMRDNGIGFDPSDPSEGHGLASMRERAGDLRGDVRISSKANEGTSVTVEIPLGRR